MLSILNDQFINDRFDRMRTSLNRLNELAKLDMDDFVLNPDSYAIAEHHLRRSLEYLLDIGRHILAKQGLGKPNNYQDVIVSLGRNGVVPLEFSERIKGMTGYRNRLVHGYADVTPEEIFEIIRTRLGDFEEFVSHVMKYVDDVKGKPD